MQHISMCIHDYGNTRPEEITLLVFTQRYTQVPTTISRRFSFLTPMFLTTHWTSYSSRSSAQEAVVRHHGHRDPSGRLRGPCRGRKAAHRREGQDRQCRHILRYRGELGRGEQTHDLGQGRSYRVDTGGGLQMERRRRPVSL